jgi:hypothetical protein
VEQSPHSATHRYFLRDARHFTCAAVHSPTDTLSSGLDRDRLHFIPGKSRWEAAANGRRSKPCRRFRFEHARPGYHRSQGGTVSSALRQHVGVIGRGFAGTSALRQLVDPARHRDSADVPSPPTTLGRGRRCRPSALERADYAPERRVVAGGYHRQRSKREHCTQTSGSITRYGRIEPIPSPEQFCRGRAVRKRTEIGTHS